MPRIAPRPASPPAVRAVMLRRVELRRAGGGQRAHLAGALAADQPDGHRQDAEGEQHADRRRAEPHVGERLLTRRGSRR